MSKPGAEAGWEAGEEGLPFARDEVRRLLRRARPRLRWILLVAAVVTSAFIAKRLWKPPKREATVTMRVIEGAMDRATAVRPAKSYQDYIWGVFLSTHNLMKVIERHKLYPDRYARDPQLAVEAMRDELDLVVWRNYFIWEHYEDDGELRTVRFSLSWASQDPQQALDVVRELRDIIIAEQTEERRQIFALGQEDLAQAGDEAVERLAVVRRAMALRRLEQQRATPTRLARLGVELRDLKSEEKALSQRVEQMGNTRTHFELTAAWERQHSSLQFEAIDSGYVLPRRGGGWKALLVSALLIFGGSCLLSGLVFGAFETKIRLPGDVRRLGVPLLGAVPAFPGDNAGALSERLRAEDRLRLESP